MKPKRKRDHYRQIVQPAEGKFAPWTNVHTRRSLMACCDCGLVHEFQYRVMIVSRVKKGKYQRLGELHLGQGIILEKRVRRLPRQTAGVRRAPRFAKVKKALGK